MTRIKRKLLLSLLGSCAALAFAAPAAQAVISWNAATHDFGSANVGIAAVPKTFTLTATCDGGVMGVCTAPPAGVHVFGTPAVTGDGFAIATPNTCVAAVLLAPTFPGAAACTTTVTFTPTSAGAKAGALNLPTGPDIALSGTGVAPASGVAGTTGKKKCKKGKKRSAAAAKKKCKKGKKN